VEALGATAEIPIWVGWSDAWRLATQSWEPSWRPWLCWAVAPIVSYIAGSGRLVEG